MSDPAVNEDQRFPLVAVVPITGTAGVGALYPALSPGESGVTKPSWVLVKLAPLILVLDTLIMLIAFRGEKQRVSDKIADTIVVRA